MMTEKQLKICVVGTGYVGLTTGVSLAYMGHNVTCIDVDREKVSLLKEGKIPIYEPYIQELMNIASARLNFTTEYTACSEADVIMLAVGTPSSSDGTADVTYLESALEVVAGYLSGQKLQVIVNKSTVSIGSAQRAKLLIDNVLDKNGKKSYFVVVSNPEFLREGTAVYDTFYPDRIVIGSDSESALGILNGMYRPVLDRTFKLPAGGPSPKSEKKPVLVCTDVTSAETIKYAANAFLALKISFINEIGGLCEQIGADVSEVARGIGLDRRIGVDFLNAGLGWGGSCLGKDTKALIMTGSEYDYKMPIVEATIRVNQKQRQALIGKLQQKLNVVRGKVIGILGLAFKPDTDDLRDAPSIEVINALIELGAYIKVYDPAAMNNCQRQYPDLKVEYSKSALDTVRNCDAAVLLTEWTEFRDLSLGKIAESMKGQKVFIDGRNVFDAAQAEQVGLNYIGFGRFAR